MQRIASIALLFLFTTAQVGLTFGVHYCQGEAVRSTLLYGSSEVPGCGMEKEEKECDADAPILKKHCCEDERTTVRNERDQIPSSPNRLEAAQQKFEILNTALFERANQPYKSAPDRERSPPYASRSSVSHLHSVRLQVFRL